MNSRKYLILLLEVGVAVVGVWLTFVSLSGEAAYAAGFCTLIYVVITAKLEIHFSQEDSFFSKFTMLNSLRNTSFDSEMIKTLESYQSIRDEILQDIADKSWNDFSNQIRNLSLNSKSFSLSSDRYIDYIEQAINNACRGQVIKAISLYLPGEFVENNFEANFHETQKKALKRGVKIERIFVCSESRMLDLKATKFWEDHLNVLKSQFADEYDVSGTGLAITTGFIMVDDIVFFDNSDNRGNLGGVVSTNPLDIAQAQQDYSSVTRHARPLSECFSESSDNC